MSEVQRLTSHRRRETGNEPRVADNTTNERRGTGDKGQSRGTAQLTRKRPPTRAKKADEGQRATSNGQPVTRDEGQGASVEEGGTNSDGLPRISNRRAGETRNNQRATRATRGPEDEDGLAEAEGNGRRGRRRPTRANEKTATYERDKGRRGSKRRREDKREGTRAKERTRADKKTTADKETTADEGNGRTRAKKKQRGEERRREGGGSWKKVEEWATSVDRRCRVGILTRGPGKGDNRRRRRRKKEETQIATERGGGRQRARKKKGKEGGRLKATRRR